MTAVARCREVGARVEPFEVTLEGLRQLHRRISGKQLERDDWPLLAALVSKQIAHAEGMQDRMIAKIAAAAAAPVATGAEDASGSALDATDLVPEGPALDAADLVPEGETAESSSSSATSGESPGSKGAPAEPHSEKPKGHGRNGVSAYTRGTEFFHALAGVLGMLCAACGLGKMTRYRVKIIIRVIGQPLFDAEIHRFEQARCRKCGHLIRAVGPACVHEGLGTDYVRYDWSTAAMLMVLHYSAGAPFKRLDSLHKGWGIPMPDANQWEIATAADDLLSPLHTALEQHATEKATNFRIDDTGSMVISLQRDIKAEAAALETLGKSTKDVRTGINATGLYWETPDGPIILYYTGRHHAGEIVDQLLRNRLLSSPKLVKCTDGASKNFDHEQGDKLIESTCNAHYPEFDSILSRRAWNVSAAPARDLLSG